MFHDTGPRAVEGKAVTISVNFCGSSFRSLDACRGLALDKPKTAAQTAVSMLVPASVAAALLDALDRFEPLVRTPLGGPPTPRARLTEWPLPVADTRATTSQR
jgi:hypothetical protein